MHTSNTMAMTISCSLLVIGGGVCGLYQAYKHISDHPENTVVLIEKDVQFGGRAVQDTFCGVTIPTGAGIGRLRKDRKLHKLLCDFGITPNTWKARVHVDSTIKSPINVPEAVNLLYKSLTEKNKDMNFKEYAIMIMGKRNYERFIDTVGYTDFEGLDAHDALHTYGFDDTYEHGQSYFSVPWNQLVDAMVHYLRHSKKCTIFTGTTLTNSAKNTAVLSNGVKVSYKDYAVAIPPSMVTKGMDFLMQPIDYRKIKCQPFLYIYAKIIDPEFRKRFSVMTVVPRPIQKIIPMDLDQGIYMIAYCDNASATSLDRIVTNKGALEQVILDTLGCKVSVQKYVKYFRTIGTHYRTSHRVYKANTHFKGEAFALNQGWTNGGL